MDAEEVRARMIMHDILVRAAEAVDSGEELYSCNAIINLWKEYGVVESSLAYQTYWYFFRNLADIHWYPYNGDYRNERVLALLFAAEYIRFGDIFWREPWQQKFDTPKRQQRNS